MYPRLLGRIRALSGLTRSKFLGAYRRYWGKGLNGSLDSLIGTGTAGVETDTSSSPTTNEGIF